MCFELKNFKIKNMSLYDFIKMNNSEVNEI